MLSRRVWGFIQRFLNIKKVEGTKKKPADQVLLHAVERELHKWKQKGSKGSVIIYAPTVKGVKRLHKWLKARGWQTKKYTGKTSQEKRAETQQAFLSGQNQIVIATNAFGLGINKPDVRLIIHAGLPLGMSGYTQEIGRAGRDGKKSKCILFYTKNDYNRNKNILNNGESRKAARRGIQDLNALKALLNSEKCMWKEIEHYFGKKPGKKCKKCCRCKSD